MKLPAPHVFNAGDQPDAIAFNDVAAGLRFLENPPEVHLLATSAQSMASGAWTAVNYQTELRDTDSMFVSGSHIVFNTPGWYDVVFGVYWDSAGDLSDRWASVRINGDITLNANYGRSRAIGYVGSTSNLTTGCGDFYVDAGAYGEVTVWQTNGAALNTKVGTTNGDHTYFRARWSSF